MNFSANQLGNRFGLVCRWRYSPLDIFTLMFENNVIAFFFFNFRTLKFFNAEGSSWGPRRCSVRSADASVKVKSSSSQCQVLYQEGRAASMLGQD